VGASSTTDLSASPTVANPLTAEGTIIGTFQYMAPEQLEGQSADARSDIFAFGAVLYEMATGHKAFSGKSQASLITAIMSHSPPPISTLQPMTPPALDRVVQRCLAKHSDERWQTARDLVLELKWIAEGGSHVAVSRPVAAPRGMTGRLWMVMAAISFLGMLILTGVFLGRTKVETRTVRLSLTNPFVDSNNLIEGAEISPDGQNLVLVASTPEKTDSLWIRSLDSLSVRALPGTKGAYGPFWSPDSRFVGFFADGKLKKINISGGPPQVICDSPSQTGGTWNHNDTIVLGGDEYSGLLRVQATGGTPIPLTRLGPNEEAHRWPYFLPDGKHFVFLGDAPRTDDHNLRLGSLDSQESVVLFNAVSNPVFAPPGYFLFVRAGTLLAQPFDPKSLSMNGDPIPLAENVLENMENHHFAFTVSASGHLIYHSANLHSELVWLDRAGMHPEAIGEEGQFRNLELSPSGRWLAFEKLDPDGRIGDLWLRDLSRGMTSRLTFHPGAVFSPVWSPDEDEIAFAYASEGHNSSLYRKSLANPSQESSLLDWDEVSNPTSWSPDGRFILFTSVSPKTTDDVWALSIDDGKAEPMIKTQFIERRARFSPDGRWISYISNESGRDEIYIQNFPASSWRYQISTNGGKWPMWGSDGKEIFYVTPGGKLVTVELKTTVSGLEAGKPEELFDFSRVTGYAVSAEG
ncbi:MAG: protein kinase, partial [Acidobacteriota bacterium]